METLQKTPSNPSFWARDSFVKEADGRKGNETPLWDRQL
jgi:hypothetical protein